MKILIGHNHYQTPGGEDGVVLAEKALLEEYGHHVYLYERSNSEVNNYSIAKKAGHLASLGYSNETYAQLCSIINEFKPDVAHFHNIFHAISPSAYAACRHAGVPVVQSLHNFRLFCSNALFYRDGQVCEDCADKNMWEGVRHGCYRKSRILTALTALMITEHWKKGTWLNNVDVYVTASEFGRQKLIRVGMPSDKIMIKPNFVYPDLNIRTHDGGYALYAGRLSEEKGLHILLEAWRDIPDIPLKIMGKGPLLEELKQYSKQHNMSRVAFLGFMNDEEHVKTMKEASFIVVPSQCYENFPLIVAEAFSCGVPVLASRLGSLKEIVSDRKTGLLFEANQCQDLADKAQWLHHHANERACMGLQARSAYEKKYSAQSNYRRLMQIYQKASELPHQKRMHIAGQ